MSAKNGTESTNSKKSKSKSLSHPEPRLGYQRDPWPGHPKYDISDQFSTPRNPPRTIATLIDPTDPAIRIGVRIVEAGRNMLPEERRKPLKDLLLKLYGGQIAAVRTDAVEETIAQLEQMARQCRYNHIQESERPAASEVEASLKLFKDTAKSVLDLYQETETIRRGTKKKTASPLMDMQRLLSRNGGIDEEAEDHLASAFEEVQLNTRRCTRDDADAGNDFVPLPYHKLAQRINENIRQVSADLTYLLQFVVDPAISSVDKGNKKSWSKRELMRQLVELFRNRRIAIPKRLDSPILDVFVCLIGAAIGTEMANRTAYDYLKETLDSEAAN